MGAFVTIFNAMGFRLTGAPFRLSAGAAGLVFLVYPVGSLSSALAGRMAGRFSRRAVVAASCLLAAAGVLVTLPGSLPAIVAGLAVMTAGFFGVHSVVSGWVPAGPRRGRRLRAGGLRCTCSRTTWGLPCSARWPGPPGAEADGRPSRPWRWRSSRPAGCSSRGYGASRGGNGSYVQDTPGGAVLLPE